MFYLWRQRRIWSRMRELRRVTSNPDDVMQLYLDTRPIHLSAPDDVGRQQFIYR